MNVVEIASFYHHEKTEKQLYNRAEY